MNIKDLMVGDWVRNDLGETQQVAELREIGAMLYYNDFYSYDEIEPIPLTPEILEKNGFVMDKEEKTHGITYHILIPTGYEANSYTIQITLYKEPICGVSVLLKIWGWIPPYDGGINDIHLCGAKYVHELQHAIRLCGIDKEIVL